MDVMMIKPLRVERSLEDSNFQIFSKMNFENENMEPEWLPWREDLLFNVIVAR